MVSPTGPAYPPRVVRLLLQALEEVLGSSGLKAVLNLSGLRARLSVPLDPAASPVTPAQVGAVLHALDELYGVRGGRGLALRAGRAAFRYGLKELGPALGLTELSFRLQPVGQKVRLVLEACAAAGRQQAALPVELVDEGQSWLWRIDGVAAGADQHIVGPGCYLLMGLLQEAAYWAGNGKNYAVEEIACRGRGAAACVLRVDKQPLD